MAGYRGRFFIRKRVWRCGGYAEVELYPVFQPPGRRRGKCRPTRECQDRLNERDAENRLRRLVLANFGEADLEVDLTYAGEESIEGALRDMTKFIRKLRKEYKKAGVELRYVYIWEQGKKSQKVHFHLILNAGVLSRDEVEALWGHGHANSRRLRLDETGLAGLTEYLTKKSRRKQRKQGQRRWCCSKNLVRPEAEVTDGAMPMGEIMALAEDIDRRNAEGAAEELLPGMTLVEAEALRNRVNRGLYVYLNLAPLIAWHGRRPVARYFSGELGGDEDEQA